MQNGIKNVKNGDLRAAKLVNPVSLHFLNEGGEFLGVENFPLPLFNHLRAGVARPGELTCIFFLGEEISTASYRSMLAYSNPRRVD